MHSNKLENAALVAPVFHPLWCLEAQRKGMVINMKRRFWAGLLAVMMLLSMITNNAFAATSDAVSLADISIVAEKIVEKLSSIERSKEVWGLSDIDFCDFCVGSPVYTYNYVDNSFKENSKLYPIIADNQLRLWASDAGGVITLSTELVDQVNAVITFDEEFSIIYDRYGCYVYVNDSYEFLTTYEGGFQDNSRSILLSGTAGDTEDLVCTKLADNFLLEYTSKPIPYASDYLYLLNVPYIDQLPDTLICWAACIDCIVQYKTGRVLTPREIAIGLYGNSDYNQTLNIQKVPGVLKGYGVSYAYYPNCPSDYMIYKNLINNDPLYTHWVRDDEKSGHACVLFGIDTYTGGGVISLMNPWGGFRQIAERVGNTYVYASISNGNTFSLRSAVVGEL